MLRRNNRFFLKTPLSKTIGKVFIVWSAEVDYVTGEDGNAIRYRGPGGDPGNLSIWPVSSGDSAGYHR